MIETLMDEVQLVLLESGDFGNRVTNELTLLFGLVDVLCLSVF